MALIRIAALMAVVAVALSAASCGRKTPPVMPPQGSSVSSTAGADMNSRPAAV